MNTRLQLLLALAASLASAPAQTPVYTNFIRQVQLRSGVEWDVEVPASGERLSALGIEDGGARFELWTILNSPLTTYLLDHKTVGTFLPQAALRIVSEDPYPELPRTRADRPFQVTVTVQGLALDDPAAPDSAKQVKLSRYVQSYGTDGDGVGIDPDQATLLSTSYIAANGETTLDFALTSVPGSDRTKLWAEERFVIESVADQYTPAGQLAAQRIQVWPVADAAIGGIVEGQEIKFALPETTLQYNDVYPSSTTYAQVYEGEAKLGTTGMMVPGSTIVVNDSAPQSHTLTLADWDSVIPDSGVWTLEVVTKTPFGLDRLAHVTFRLDRDIEINASVNDLE
jgi:hypothetical protein